MNGTILILDGVSTNRIMLKVQLSAAWYHVVQADRIAGVQGLIARCRPDLIVAATDLPDGSVFDLMERLRASELGSGIPVIAVTAQNDRAARLRALAAGIDDVLSQPVDDVLLLARIRCLLRARSSREELRLPAGIAGPLGLSEAAAAFAAPGPAARVALVTRQVAGAARWRARLRDTCPHELSCHGYAEAHALISGPAPDAIVVELTPGAGETGLRLLADLRARGATRNAALICVVDPRCTALAAEALDRGAHDVIAGGFCAEELALRLASQLRSRARSERMRADLRDGLRAAVRDPLTGLFNRRYALPRLARLARHAMSTGEPLAVMLADLDHFKAINDRHGHLTGDAVLVETAARINSAMRPGDLLARVGGEECLIALPATDARGAAAMARRLCTRMNGEPFSISGEAPPIPVTISIGVVIGPAGLVQADSDERIATRLIDGADRALYGAKDAGRNQITLAALAA